MKTNNTPTPRTDAAFNGIILRIDDAKELMKQLECEVAALKDKLNAANEDADKMLHFAGHRYDCALWTDKDGDTPGITKEQQFPPCTCGFTQHLAAHRARMKGKQ